MRSLCLLSGMLLLASGVGTIAAGQDLCGISVFVVFCDNETPGQYDLHWTWYPDQPGTATFDVWYRRPSSSSWQMLLDDFGTNYYEWQPVVQDSVQFRVKINCASPYSCTHREDCVRYYPVNGWMICK